MSTDDRIRAAFEDLARQAEHSDPEPGLAAVGSGGDSAQRPPWLGAVAAGAVIVAAIGVIALFQRGDDPTAPAGPPTTTTTPAPTTVPVSPTIPAEQVTETTTAGEVAAGVTRDQPTVLLADQTGITAIHPDGRTGQLTGRPAEVAYPDGRGGLVYQGPGGRIVWVTPSGEELELDADGDLQGLFEIGPDRVAVVIERSPIADTEVFEGRVVALDLATGVRSVLDDRGDTVRYSRWGEYVAVTSAAEESTTFTVLRGDTEMFTLHEPSGAIISGGIVIRGTAGVPRFAYFRNDLASNSSQILVLEANGEIVGEHQIDGIGMWLDAVDGRVAATFGDGTETFGFALIDLSTGDQQRPPFPGTATLLTGPVPTGSGASTAENVRWRITGIDEGAFLNVRAGSGIEHERIGRLFPEDEMVEITGEGVLDPDGSGWYEVRLEDGTVGFTSTEFLTPPPDWEVGFQEVPCGDGSAVQTTPSPAAGGTVGSAIGGWAHVTDDQCDRYVVAFTVGGPGDGRIVSADHVPGGLRMGAGPARISVTLPGVSEVEPVATHAVLGETFALIAQPADLNAPLEIRLLRAGANARMSVLSHPARLLIDVPKAGAGAAAGLPVIGVGATLLEAPVDPDGAGVTAPVTVTGYARWFEAQGHAEVRDLAGGPALATVGGPSVSAGGPGREGSAGVYAAWYPTWGEFVVTIDAAAGDYQLFIGEECLVDDVADVWELCGVTERFTVIN